MSTPPEYLQVLAFEEDRYRPCRISHVGGKKPWLVSEGLIVWLSLLLGPGGPVAREGKNVSLKKVVGCIA